MQRTRLRTTIASIILVFAVSLVAPGCRTARPSVIYAQDEATNAVFQGTARVETITGPGTAIWGSGFVLNNGVLVTIAQLVPEKAVSVKVNFDGHRMILHPEWFSRSEDGRVVGAKIELSSRLVVSPAGTSLGDWTIVAGLAGEEGDPSLLAGEATVGSKDSSSGLPLACVIADTGSANSGFMGGPIVGEWGVVGAVWSFGDDRIWAIPATSIRSAVAAVAAGPDVPVPKAHMFGAIAAEHLAKEEVTFVRTERADGSGSMGSGVVLADGTLLTAAHVVREAVRVTLTRGDKTVEVAGSDFVSDDTRDVAAVRTDFTSTLQLAPEEPVPGDWVVVTGHPDAVGHESQSQGPLLWTYPEGDDHGTNPLSYAAARSERGCSGGPVFWEGGLCGIISGGAADGSEMCFAPLESLRVICERLKLEQQTR